mmetsp:Transcript_60491/g.128235  ORF Transcript_60491/g.128235 Transcript_60491/m.128235 type:complete len:282 (+) Transcript_60491:2420-3265(+)
MLCITGQRKVWQKLSVLLKTCSSIQTGMQPKGASNFAIFLCSTGSDTKTPGWPTNLMFAPLGMDLYIIETTLNVISSPSSSTTHSSLFFFSLTGNVLKIAKMWSSLSMGISFSLTWFWKLSSLGIGTLPEGASDGAAIGDGAASLPAVVFRRRAKLGAIVTSRYKPSSSSATRRRPVGITSRFPSNSSHLTTSPLFCLQTTYLYCVLCPSGRKTPFDVQQASSTLSRCIGTAHAGNQFPSASEAPTTLTSSSFFTPAQSHRKKTFTRGRLPPAEAMMKKFL